MQTTPPDVKQDNGLTSGAGHIPPSRQVQQMGRPAHGFPYASHSGMNDTKGNATFLSGQSPLPGGQKPPRPPTPPMLQRYIREGQQGHGQHPLDRECYPKGPHGMAKFLHDWEKLWQQASKNADRTGRSSCCEH